MIAYQISTMNALMLGHFEGVAHVKEVLAKGGFGLGTYEGLDGEAILLDGKAYKGLPGGEIREAAPKEKMAFGVVAPFQMAGTVFQAKSIPSIEELKERIDEVRRAECKSDNYLCFARVDGLFQSVTVRSCAKETPPYRTMFLASKDQVETTKEGVEGTLLGFWFPAFMEGINLTGWHFHFISRDRKSLGGHCLSCSLESGLIGAKKIAGLNLLLPSDEPFEKLDFNQDLKDQTALVEGKSQR